MLASIPKKSHQTPAIALLAVCASLLMSWLSIRNNAVLSPDSLLYIFTAQTFLDEGLKAATESYPWPFLSILIAGIHKVTGIPMMASGYILASLLYAGICSTFVLLVKDLGGSIRTQLLALLVIIIFPTLNDYRDYITRDPGFWLFSLLSIQQLLHYVRNNRFKNALGWFAFTLVAIGFRTEAVFFLVLAPVLFFTDKQLTLRQRLNKALILCGLISIIALLALIAVIASPQLASKLRLVAEFANLPLFFETLANGYNQTVNSFARVAPHQYAADDMGVIISTGLIGLVFYSLLHALTLPYLLVLLWQRKSVLPCHLQERNYLLGYLVIILFYLVLLSFKKYFMTDRFCVAAILIIMLALPFCIEKAWSDTRPRIGWRRCLIIFLLLVPALDSLINSKSDKAYIANAADWVHISKSQDDRLLTNHKQIAVLGANCLNDCYRENIEQLIIEAAQKKPEILAIRLKEEETELSQGINELLEQGYWTLAQQFENKGGDKVIILVHRSPDASIIK